ncbi:MAG TPA: UDP-N-acetylglucosamine 2-epimerase (non-hydrolyzing) [Blastocatellia bacterium]|nr:UDP-N-acetylglucosamine 2-epimerase (non-hydrolyzing) [Blastocatellia bacterium]
MKKLRVMTVVGTRPEIIRLSRVMAALDRTMDHVIVHTGQNYDYELNGIFFEDLELRKPDHFLEAAGATAAETIGQVIARADAVMRQVRPDALLVLGDTNSSLSAITAKRLRIPVFHMEAGNRCFDERVPEEINRRIVDHISDINLPYSSLSREYLLREGIAPERVIKTGSPMREVLEHYMPKVDRSVALKTLKLKPQDYFLVSAHREETVDDARQLKRLVDVLNAVAETHERRVIVSTHPRTRKRLDESSLKPHRLIELVKPLGFTDYVRLQLDALAVLSDSGTITEEASILNLRAVNIRESHERPEGMEEAAVIMTGLDSSVMLQALELVIKQRTGIDRDVKPVSDYSPNNVSEKVVRIILSYTGYVRRRVWYELG